MIPNLRHALELRVRRIGHGVGLCYGEAVESGESTELLRQAAESGVTVEACITGNLTRSRVLSYKEHPVRQMVDAGVKVCLNVDNLTLSGDPEYAAHYALHDDLSYAYPAGEVAHLIADCGFTWAEARELLVNGARAAFGADADSEFIATYASAVDAVLMAEGVV